MGEKVTVTWGTSEEFLLAGAVHRHGTQNWTVVAKELQARTSTPEAFTPEVCEAKYEESQQHYSSCTAWFEELRKKRVAELKRDLKQSEDSIGSLESKLQSLKAEKNEKDDHPVDNGPELHGPKQNLEKVESIDEELPKDGQSTECFALETQKNQTPEFQAPAPSSGGDMEARPEVGPIEHEEVFNVDKSAHTTYEGQEESLRKSRGKRKMMDCGININEASGRESGFSAHVSRRKESSTSSYGEVVKSYGINEENTNLRDEIKDMMEILDSILKIRGAFIFCYRNDSQKQAKYDEIIRQHMDFETIRSRIKNQTIKTVMEVFRDLLLLANNALVFYSKNSREHKYALKIRTHVTKIMREKNVKRASKSVNNNSIVGHPCVEVIRRVRPDPNERHITLGLPASRCCSTFGLSLKRGKKPMREEDSTFSMDSLPISKAFGRNRRLGWEPSGEGTSMQRGRTKP